MTEYIENFLGRDSTLKWLRYFDHPEIEWVRESFQMFGRTTLVPRKLVWFADKDLNYRYTGLDHVGTGWPHKILELKKMVEEESHCDFNFLLVNRYETGEEYMGWHRDNEKNASQKIASLSLGERRKFRLKEGSTTRDIWLDSGSLLIFDGYLKHTLPKMKKVNNSRVNLTFRRLID